jgi:protoporphyrinogen/coproporphyrinogen III oxidase
MKKTRVLILGAGISGLSLAWYLSRHAKDIEISILEKADDLGGWMRTDASSGYLFEKGPRTFKASRCNAILELAEEVGVGQEIIFSDQNAKARYVLFEGRLHPLPSNPLQMFRSPIAKGLIPALLKEWCAPVGNVPDESVWDFVCRRFNPYVAERLFDPLVLGIYAGDIRTLSAKACFPVLKSWEETYGSLTKGFFAHIQRKRPSNHLFTFRNGMQELIKALARCVKAQIYVDQEAASLRFTEEGVTVKTTRGEVFSAEHIFSTLPAHCMHDLFQPFDEELSAMFSELKANDITVVNCGYTSDVLTKKGFGYLVPTSQREEVLGVLFDSSVFPQQNQRPRETRLTVMVRGISGSLDIALKALEKHLGITSAPDFTMVSKLSRAIPQYHVGHIERIQKIEARLQNYPRAAWLGNYLSGVSVNDCIVTAKNTAEAFNDRR